MTKAEVISQYDPQTLIDIPPGVNNISSVFVENGILKATNAAAEVFVLGKYTSQAGKAMTTAALLPDGRIVVEYNDETVGYSQPIKNRTERNVTYSGVGLYVEAKAVVPSSNAPTPEPGLFYLIENNPTFPTNTLTQAITSTGIKVTTTSTYNTNYYPSKMLRRLPPDGAVNGFIWANGAPIAQMNFIVELPEETECVGYYYNIHRLDWCTTSWEISVSNDGVDWTFVHTKTIPKTLDVHYMEFPLPTTFKFIRFKPLVNVNDGGVGRFDLVVQSKDFTLNHQGFEFDPGAFDVEETESAFLVSKKSGGEQSSESQNNVVSYSNYARLTATAPSPTYYLPGDAYGWPVLVDLNQIVQNTAGVGLSYGNFKLPPGKWRVDVKLSINGGVSGTVGIMNAKTQIFAALPEPIFVGPPSGNNNVLVSVTFEILVLEEAPVFYLALTMLSNCNPTAAPNPYAIVDLWKMAEETKPLTKQAVRTLPPTINEADYLPILLMPSVLATAAPQLTDGLNPTAGNFSFSFNQKVVIVLTDYCRLWRCGISATAGANTGQLRIQRLEDNHDYTNKHLPCTALTNVEWEPWTETLPPGTYLLTCYRARSDGEWVAERMPAYAHPKVQRQIVPYPMVSATHPKQVIAASSTYSGSYPLWYLFSYAQLPDNGDWLTSAPGNVPFWITLEFLDGPKKVNGLCLTHRHNFARFPKAFVLQGRNNTADAWVDLYSVTDTVWQGLTGSVYFENIGEFEYSQYRLYVSEVHILPNDPGYSALNRFYLFHDTLI